MTPGAIYQRCRHLYLNKYILRPLQSRRYHLSYCIDHRALWFRTYKVASRSIDRHFREGSRDGYYIYGSPVGYLPSLYKSYFKFAFVRHPVDRIHSLWRDKVLQNRHQFGLDSSQFENLTTFEGFVDWLETLDLDEADQHLIPQAILIDLENVDFIGRFENFSEDFSYLADRVGLEVGEIHRLNVTERRNEPVPEILADRIRDLYAEDVRLFYPPG